MASTIKKESQLQYDYDAYDYGITTNKTFPLKDVRLFFNPKRNLLPRVNLFKSFRTTS